MLPNPQPPDWQRKKPPRMDLDDDKGSSSHLDWEEDPLQMLLDLVKMKLANSLEELLHNVIQMMSIFMETINKLRAKIKASEAEIKALRME